MVRNKDRFFKAAREKNVKFEGNGIKLTKDLYETIQARKQWNYIFKHYRRKKSI